MSFLAESFAESVYEISRSLRVLQEEYVGPDVLDNPLELICGAINIGSLRGGGPSGPPAAQLGDADENWQAGDGLLTPDGPLPGCRSRLMTAEDVADCGGWFSSFDPVAALNSAVAGLADADERGVVGRASVLVAAAAGRLGAATSSSPLARRGNPHPSSPRGRKQWKSPSVQKANENEGFSAESVSTPCGEADDWDVCSQKTGSEIWQDGDTKTPLEVQDMLTQFVKHHRNRQARPPPPSESSTESPVSDGWRTTPISDLHRSAPALAHSAFP